MRLAAWGLLESGHDAGARPDPLIQGIGDMRWVNSRSKQQEQMKRDVQTAGRVRQPLRGSAHVGQGLSLIALTLLRATSNGGQALAGSIFITGHDPVWHSGFGGIPRRGDLRDRMCRGFRAQTIG